MSFAKEIRNEETHVPIRSVWLLQLYASHAYTHGSIVDGDVDKHDTELAELAVEMLCDSVEKRLRHDLTRGFTIGERTLARVRGRIDTLKTAREHLLEKGLVACRFNELTTDSPVNQFLRTALETGFVLMHAQSSPELAQRCRRLASRLAAAGVSLPTTTPQLPARLLPADQSVLDIAQLLLDFAIPAKGKTGHAFARAEMTQPQLRALFERALLGVFRYHLSPLGWRVSGAERLAWNTDSSSPFIPGMLTDIMLRSPEGKLVIVDAKFTDLFATSRFTDALTLKNEHMYQLYAYLRSQEHRGEEWTHASGMMLYATAASESDVDFNLDGHRISFRSVSLDSTPRAFRESVLRSINLS
ncbi:hypothetical protein HMPREF2635_05195 [Corynebacterium sp. HMSC035E02]|nr:hypothetical protein HMPREF2635_05195 [Corynebacterium sp. HMSC035E02]